MGDLRPEAGPGRHAERLVEPLLLVVVGGVIGLGASQGALFALLLRWVAGWRRRLPVLSDYETAEAR